MPKLAQLEEPQRVQHRSSKRIMKEGALINLAPKDHNKIFVKFDNSALQPEEISIDQIESVKPKNYNDSSANYFNLSIVKKDGQHTNFQFDPADGGEEKRNVWDAGLRSLITGEASKAKSETKVPNKPLLPIKSIVLQKPQPNQLVLIKVDLGKEGGGETRSAELVVPMDHDSKDKCRNLAVEFVDQNAVLQTETTSLYRYIRSVVQRARMEKEVNSIVEEVNAQTFDRRKQESPSVSNDQLVNDAQAKLNVIYSQIPTRIGQHGSGATIVTQVLKRNIDKMKLINKMAAKLADGGQAPGPATAGPSQAA